MVQEVHELQLIDLLEQTQPRPEDFIVSQNGIIDYFNRIIEGTAHRDF